MTAYLLGLSLASVPFLVGYATNRLILFVAERPARLPRAEVVRW